MTDQSTRILHYYNALVYINLYNRLINTKQVRMARKCHNHRPLTNTRHHKDEALEHRLTMTYTLKQNLLSLPQQDDCNFRKYTKNYICISQNRIRQKKNNITLSTTNKKPTAQQNQFLLRNKKNNFQIRILIWRHIYLCCRACLYIFVLGKMGMVSSINRL